MQRSTTFVSLATVVALVGCGASPQDAAQSSSSESAYTAETARQVTWNKVLSCDNGAAILDENASDHKDLQFVVRDRNIARWLRSQMQNLPEDSSMAKAPQYAGWIQPVLNEKGELIVWSNDVQNDVNSASDFGKDDIVYSQAYRLGDYFVIVKRDGPGITLIIADKIHVDCVGGQWLYEGGCRNAQAYRAYAEHEVANWYFQDCH